jgi:hypothetical protein
VTSLSYFICVFEKVIKGGHAINPRFSSTTGVQIYVLIRRSQYNPGSRTADSEIDAGLVWDDVYAAAEPCGVNVVGGRTTVWKLQGYLGRFVSIFMDISP